MRRPPGAERLDGRVYDSIACASRSKEAPEVSVAKRRVDGVVRGGYIFGRYFYTVGAYRVPLEETEAV
jgi:hypothetical protein